MIELDELSVTYGEVTGLHPTSLVLPDRCLVAVTGPSGAGKSSLLLGVAGVVPHAGSVAVDGTALRRGTGGDDIAGTARAGVVLIPQGNGLARSLTALENVVLPLTARGVTDPLPTAERALAEVGLAESGTHLVEELSGGQQQRVAVARGLSLSGRVLLADESTSDLDATNRGVVLAAFRAEAHRGATVLFATNDLEAAAECDAHAVLDEGRLGWERRPAG